MCKQWSALILWASVVSVPDLRNSFSESSTKQQRQHANKRWSKLVGAIISQKHMRAHHICNVNANAPWTTVKERLLVYALSNAFIFTLRSRLTGSCIPWNQSHDPDVASSRYGKVLSRSTVGTTRLGSVQGKDIFQSKKNSMTCNERLAVFTLCLFQEFESSSIWWTRNASGPLYSA